VKIGESYPDWINQQNMGNCLRNTRKKSFMALWKLDFIMDHYGWKSELPHNLVEASQVEYQQNLWNDLQKTQGSPFVALCELGFTVDQYGWNLELVEVSNIGYRLTSGLWDTWKRTLTALCNLGFIMDQYAL
jgi:hypothetical protein